MTPISPVSSVNLPTRVASARDAAVTAVTDSYESTLSLSLGPESACCGSVMLVDVICCLSKRVLAPPVH